MLRYIVLIVSYFICCFGDSTTRLYDLSSDPKESYNLANNDAYEDVISFFEDKFYYWNQTIGEVEDYTNDGMWDAFEENNGIVPWLNSSYTPRTIEQKFFYDDAPHIIFVLVDDWGYNDYGKRSTYMNWTTPVIDQLASEGILLTNYYTNYLCVPSRATFLTGRYAHRLGIRTPRSELKLEEVTVAQELESAGYRSYVIGKWNVGGSTYNHLPTNRGFDYFYGYLSGFQDYWTKKVSSFDNYVDLTENVNLVTNEDDLSSDYHTGFLYQTKVEDILLEHSTSYPDTPMFLFYSLQLIHSP